MTWKNKIAFVLGAVLLTALTFGIANANVIIPPDAILSQANSWTAAQTFNSGNLKLKGSSTGVTTLNSGLSGAGNNTLTLPITSSDTLAALGTIETFTAAQTFGANVVVNNGATLTHGSNIGAAFGTAGVDLVGSAFTQTDSTTGAGTVTTAYASVFGAPTYATAANAVTITNAYTLDVELPVAGAHTTLTNARAAFFNGAVNINAGGLLLGNNNITNIGAALSNNANGFELNSGAASCTAPTLAPNRGTTNTGVGGGGTTLCFDVSGSDDMDFGSTTAATWTVPSGAHVSLLDATIKLTGLANATANAIVCWTTATGLLTENTAANCVASLEEYKIISRNIDGAEAHRDVQALKPFWFKYKKDFSCRSAHCAPDPQDIYDLPGLGAHYTAKVDPRLGSYSNGKLASVQYAQLTAVLAANEQYMQAEISSLKREIAELKRRPRR